MNDTITSEKRLLAYRNASVPVKNLYGSLELGEVIGVLVTKNNFDEQKRLAFIDLIGDTILGFKSPEDFKNELSALGIDSAHIPEIEKTIGVFFNSLNATAETVVLPSANKDTREKLELRPEGIENASGTNENSPRPLTREEVLRAIAPTRTMQKDIASIKDESGASSPVRGYEAYEEGKRAGE